MLRGVGEALNNNTQKQLDYNNHATIAQVGAHNNATMLHTPSMLQASP